MKDKKAKKARTIKVRRKGIQLNSFVLFVLLCGWSGIAVHAQDKTPPTPKVTGNIVTLADGYTFEADEVWKQGDETWYRKGLDSLSRSPVPC